MLAGIAIVLLFAFHGATFLTLRTSGELCERAAAAARRLALPVAVVAAAFLVWTVAVAHDRNDSAVCSAGGRAGRDRDRRARWWRCVLVAGAAGAWAFAMTAVGVLACVATLFTGLYPRVMVSQPGFANSLTVSNAASDHYALAVIDGRGGDLHPARAALPGLDVPRLPRARRRRRRARRWTPLPTAEPATVGRLRPMRALDPRLLRARAAARPLLVLDGALGLATVVPVLRPGHAAGARRRAGV